MRYILLYIFILFISSCTNSSKENVYTKKHLLSTISQDSLIFNKEENSYYDKYGDSSGSLYKFNNENNLIFYCFLNGKSYPFAEYYDSAGHVIKTEGYSAVQYRYSKNPDSSFRFTFLYSTFRKSKYRIVAISNFLDTSINGLSPAKGFSHVGYFNLVVRTRADVNNTTLYNNVSFYDSLKKISSHYIDTVELKKIIENVQEN